MQQIYNYIKGVFLSLSMGFMRGGGGNVVSIHRLSTFLASINVKVCMCLIWTAEWLNGY